MQRFAAVEAEAGHVVHASSGRRWSEGASRVVLGSMGIAWLIACGADVRIRSGTPDGGVADSGSSGPDDEPAVGRQVLYEGEDNPSAIAVDDRYVYWASLDVLRRAPLAGGAPVTLASGNYLRGMMLAGDHVYFFQSAQGTGSIDRVAKEGGASERLASALQPSSLAIRGAELFWSDRAVVGGTGHRARAVELAVRRPRAGVGG